MPEKIVKQANQPAIFKWRQTAPELILGAVRWYLRYSLSLRDVEELFAERGLEADHTTIPRWVQRYGPELEQRLPSACSAGLSAIPRIRNPASLTPIRPVLYSSAIAGVKAEGN